MSYKYQLQVVWTHCTVCNCLFITFFFLQPLVFTTFSLAKAEEMADLIDGYCMLFSGNKHSLVFKKLGNGNIS